MACRPQQRTPAARCCCRSGCSIYSVPAGQRRMPALQVGRGQEQPTGGADGVALAARARQAACPASAHRPDPPRAAVPAAGPTTVQRASMLLAARGRTGCVAAAWRCQRQGPAGAAALSRSQCKHPTVSSCRLVIGSDASRSPARCPPAGPFGSSSVGAHEMRMFQQVRNDKQRERGQFHGLAQVPGMRHRSCSLPPVQPKSSEGLSDAGCGDCKRSCAAMDAA